MGKKSKKSAAAAPTASGLISDTKCLGLGNTSWESIYNLIETEEPEEISEEATANSSNRSKASLKDLACSYLHRIAAREKILPYTDVVRWIVEGIPVSNRTFCTVDGRIFGSFQPDDLRKMYHLPEPEKRYNKAFLEKFANENESVSAPIKQWRLHPEKHKHESSGKYSVESLASPYCYAGAMMCRMWGIHDSAKFTIEMVPLMEAAVNSYVMDWANILSDKLATAILEYRSNSRKTTRTLPAFYYSAYIMDTLCFNSEYPVLGWRWTPQDPKPIHIYHQMLWKAPYKDHLYKICNGFMLPVHYAIFDKPAPRISEKAQIDLTAVANWFGEDKFTYIRLFGSLTKPHVLPLYVPDKLLARELAYQITTEGTSKTLRNSKKQAWPTFPLRCGVFTLHDYKHAEKETEKMKMLNLPTIPNRQYDPRKVAYNVLEQAKLAKFDHEKDDFDDLFSSAESLFQVKTLARIKYQDEGLEVFNRLREQRLQTLPLDLLATTPAIQSSEPEQQTVDRSPAVEKIPEKEKAPEQEKEQGKGSVHMDIDTRIDPKLLKEWQQFDSIISNPENSQGFSTPEVTIGHKTATNTVPTEGTSGLPISKDVEIILKDSSDEVVLHIEEIPPLDVFYSPKHRAIVKRQRKKRRIDQSSLLPAQTETANVVWKEEFNPSEDLTKLSQYAGAYSAATMDKASEVSNLLKEKDQTIVSLEAQVSERQRRIEQLEQQLAAQQQVNNQLNEQLLKEKQRIDQSAAEKQKELSLSLAKLKTMNEQMSKTKDEQIAQLSQQIEKFKSFPQPAEFRSEALQINKALIKQLNLLCHNISLAEPLCEISSSMIDKSVDARQSLEQANETLTNFLAWQETSEGQAANLPKILESHKEILFLEWQSQLMKAERETSRCKSATGNLIELINDTLYLSNLISQCTPGKLPSAKALEQSCKQDLEQKERLIAGIQSLTWDTFWFFLVKPYSQRAALKCLTDAIGYMIPEIHDATYSAQLHSRLSHPPELQPMLAICQLKPKDDRPKQ